MAKCGKRCEVFSRVVGYHRPINNWNVGKKAEFEDRTCFCENSSLESKFATAGKPTIQVAEKQTTL